MPSMTSKSVMFTPSIWFPTITWLFFTLSLAIKSDSSHRLSRIFRRWLLGFGSRDGLDSGLLGQKGFGPMELGPVQVGWTDAVWVAGYECGPTRIRWSRLLHPVWLQFWDADFSLLLLLFSPTKFCGWWTSGEANLVSFKIWILGSSSDNDDGDNHDINLLWMDVPRTLRAFQVSLLGI